jgi:hypothetical protein
VRKLPLKKQAGKKIETNYVEPIVARTVAFNRLAISKEIVSDRPLLREPCGSHAHTMHVLDKGVCPGRGGDKAAPAISMTRFARRADVVLLVQKNGITSAVLHEPLVNFVEERGADEVVISRARRIVFAARLG